MPNHAGGKVFLDAVERGGRRGFQEFGSELEAMGPVVVPAPARREPLAGGDGRRVTNGSHQVFVAAGLHAQNTKAVLLIVEGNPLDKASKYFGLIGVNGHDGKDSEGSA
jgi:hypothetical protein